MMCSLAEGEFKYLTKVSDFTVGRSHKSLLPQVQEEVHKPPEQQINIVTRAGAARYGEERLSAYSLIEHIEECSSGQEQHSTQQVLLRP